MTSGTTGLPKSIGYTHRKYLDSVRLISQAIDFSRPSGTQDVNMLGMPLTGPGSGLVLPTLLSGSALLMPENFHAETLARLIARHRVTRAFLSPSAIIDLLDDPALARHDLSSLRHVPYGSEMMPAAKVAEAVRRFGPIFQQGYGCLEALPPHHLAAAARACGRCGRTGGAGHPGFGRARGGRRGGGHPRRRLPAPACRADRPDHRPHARGR